MSFLLSRKIKCFIMVMEERCINAAADKLFITRSPLSKTIHEIEELFHTRLFERKYNELIPTSTAIHFYNAIKPLCESLESIEQRFLAPGGAKTFEIVFDVSIPYCFYKYLVYTLQTGKIHFTHSRTLVTQEILERINHSERVIIFSMRDINITSNITKYLLKEDVPELLMASSVTEENLNDIDFMRKFPLFIRPSDYINEIKTRVSGALNMMLPFIFYQEVDFDPTTTLYSVIHKKGMILLPARIAALYSSPGLTRIAVKGVTYKNIMLYSTPLKHLSEITKIRKMVQDAY
ncbi:LysR family transcriptional regulator [Siccibacter turicensis]|uniref:LysR family transcriptional regulator n=1 Tax=Siccibacter turicensis TaxID=357233 RepID=UPI0010207F13|nr:LysR family transcriptional regulator [Siccibacter turicensis]